MHLFFPANFPSIACPFPTSPLFLFSHINHPDLSPNLFIHFPFTLHSLDLSFSHLPLTSDSIPHFLLIFHLFLYSSYTSSTSSFSSFSSPSSPSKRKYYCVSSVKCLVFARCGAPPWPTKVPGNRQVRCTSKWCHLTNMTEWENGASFYTNTENLLCRLYTEWCPSAIKLADYGNFCRFSFIGLT